MSIYITLESLYISCDDYNDALHCCAYIQYWIICVSIILYLFWAFCVLVLLYRVLGVAWPPTVFYFSSKNRLTYRNEAFTIAFLTKFLTNSWNGIFIGEFFFDWRGIETLRGSGYPRLAGWRLKLNMCIPWIWRHSLRTISRTYSTCKYLNLTVFIFMWGRCLQL